MVKHYSNFGLEIFSHFHLSVYLKSLSRITFPGPDLIPRPNLIYGLILGPRVGPGTHGSKPSGFGPGPGPGPGQVGPGTRASTYGTACVPTVA